jgi:hypothetical protein
MLDIDYVNASQAAAQRSAAALSADAEWLRELEIDRAKEAAAKTELQRVCREAASPVWPLPEDRIAYAAPRAAPAPVARVSAAPVTAKPTTAQLQAREDAFWAAEVQAGRAGKRASVEATTVQPILHGGPSPSLAKLIRSQGQEPLMPPEGSYYLPRSAAGARRVGSADREQADAAFVPGQGICSPTLRRLLEGKGMRPLQPEPGSYWLPAR